jgi:hypothetical protein
VLVANVDLLSPFEFFDAFELQAFFRVLLCLCPERGLPLSPCGHLVKLYQSPVPSFRQKRHSPGARVVFRAIGVF